MTEKHRQRWELEVQIMQRLQHENVIAALQVPPPLDVQPLELPLLAMEYCSGGDLRKVKCQFYKISSNYDYHAIILRMQQKMTINVP